MTLFEIYSGLPESAKAVCGKVGAALLTKAVGAAWDRVSAKDSGER